MFSYIIDLYNRAIKNQALTPRERAALKAIQGVLIGVVTDLATQLVPILAKGGTINFSRTAFVSLLLGFILGLVKLWASQSDPAVGVVLDAYSKELEQQGIQGLTAQHINGTLHVPAVQLIIPSSAPVTASGLIPVASSPVQTLATEQDITQHNTHVESAAKPNINASEIVTAQDRAQFASPAPWSHVSDQTVPMTQPSS